MSLTELTDEELMARLDALCARNTKLLVQLLLHLGEVDARGLFRDDGHHSMFAYCKERLRMCESAIWRRLHAARLCRRSARLGGLIETGVVHLSSLAMIEPKVTDERLEVLIDQIAGKSKADIEKLVARARPKPKGLAPSEPRAGNDVAPSEAQTAPVPSLEGLKMAAQQRSRVAPLSDGHELLVVMSDDTKAKLERVVELMSHSNPTGDLAVVFERAVDALLEKLEKRRFGSRSPKQTAKPGPARAGYVSREKTAQVFDRDGHQCTYVSKSGRRCTARRLLQLDHIKPRARGGEDEVDNLRVRCRPHNQLYAEQVYGAEHVARRIRERRRRGAG